MGCAHWQARKLGSQDRLHRIHDIRDGIDREAHKLSLERQKAGPSARKRRLQGMEQLPRVGNHR